MNKLLASASVLLLFSACATADIDESSDLERPQKEKRLVSGDFEWAVQHYEAGAYAKAIEKFGKLRHDGPSLKGYDRLPYYLGMSHFHLEHFSDAARELEFFLQAAGDGQEQQDARLALLQTYEKLGRWKDVSALASETDKKTLFQDNRALLKLLWARSLREQGEIQGAKAVLQEALPFLDKLEKEDRAIPFYANPGQDLWGRYYFTSISLQELECNRPAPKDLAEGKKLGKGKPRLPQRLYPSWLESVTDCFRKAVGVAADELFFRESPWSTPAEQSLENGISIFSEKLKGFLRDESTRLNQYRALQRNAQEHLYRLLGTIDEHLKNFKNRDLNSTHLLNIRKQVDRLLVAISNPS